MSTSYEAQRKRKMTENRAELQRLGISVDFGKTAAPRRKRQATEGEIETEEDPKWQERLRARTNVKSMSDTPRRKKKTTKKAEECQQAAPPALEPRERHRLSEPSAFSEERYTREQAKRLGSCKRPYPFSSIPKLADASGTLCHQCLQRTRDRKTECSSCHGDRGRLCGPCLQARYGENILEAISGARWECPACRGFCNCASCRAESGLRPVGVMLPVPGFQSIAHWLVLTHLRGGDEEEDEEGVPSD